MQTFNSIFHYQLAWIIAIKRFILQFFILFKPNHLFMIQWHSIEVLENIPRIFCEKFFHFPNMQCVNIIFVKNPIYNFDKFSFSFWRNWVCYIGGNNFINVSVSKMMNSQSLLKQWFDLLADSGLLGRVLSRLYAIDNPKYV